MEEILFNLIVNACHAMPKGGTLTISAEERGAGNKSLPVPFSDHVVITISDTGTGISSDQLKHLFEPFHTTKGEKGTGLGLYITKQLIGHNNGRVMVSSEQGKGSAFRLEFKTIKE